MSLVTRDPDTFLAAARACAPDWGAPCARAAFLVAPDGFALAEESASDNAYMAMQAAVDPQRALRQHRDLHRALSQVVPVVCFAGDPATPDAVFPNNVFATTPTHVLIAHMRHPVRQREADRADILAFFERLLGRQRIDLRAVPGIGELTGSLVIDRARGLGFCGLSERCDAAGAAAMHEAFGLRATLCFALAPGEYHANVVMSVLAGRAAVLCPDGFADAAVVDAIAALYAPAVVRLSPAEKAAFAGNCIALDAQAVWMSATAEAALSPASRMAFQHAGFALRSVALDEIEKAGGSLRCCVGEIF